MSNTECFLESITRSFRMHFAPSLRVCAIHPGSLNTNVRQRVLRFSPTAFLSLLEMKVMEVMESDAIRLDVSLALIVVSQLDGGPDPKRSMNALILQIQHFLVGQTWHLDFAMAPEEIRSLDMTSVFASPDNSSLTGKDGLIAAKCRDLLGEAPLPSEVRHSVWTVSWSQGIVLHHQNQKPLLTKITHLNDVHVSAPNLQSIQLTGAFSRIENRIRKLSGTLQVDFQEQSDITAINLYWADGEGHRVGREKITTLPPESPAVFSFDPPISIPKQAESVMALALGRTGISPQAAYAPIADLWYEGADMVNALSPIGDLQLHGAVHLWSQVDANGYIQRQILNKSSMVWTSDQISANGIEMIVAIHQEGESAWIVGKQSGQTGLFEYDLQQDEWTTANLFPVQPGGIESLGSTMLAGMGVIVSSGADGFSDGIFTCDLRKHGNEYSSWYDSEDFPTDPASIAPPPFSRKEMAICGSENHLFLVGGSSPVDDFLDSFSSYDLMNGVWRELPPLPIKVRNLDSVVAGGKIFVFGGETTEGLSDRVFCYDIYDNVWEELASMPDSRISSQAFELEDNIWLCGGLSGSQTLLRSTNIYVPKLTK
jgi:hypothetical protein